LVDFEKSIIALADSSTSVTACILWKQLQEDSHQHKTTF